MKRVRYAVFYITPEGESDCEGVYVAKSKKDALRAFEKMDVVASRTWAIRTAPEPK